MQGDLADAFAALDTKLDIEKMDEIESLLVKLPRAADVADLKWYTIENIENFAADNNAFHEEHKKHKEIIRRYDEVISTKAEKWALTTGLSEVNTRLQGNLDNVSKSLAKSQGQIKDHGQ